MSDKYTEPPSSVGTQSLTSSSQFGKVSLNEESTKNTISDISQITEKKDQNNTEKWWQKLLAQPLVLGLFCFMVGFPLVLVGVAFAREGFIQNVISTPVEPSPTPVLASDFPVLLDDSATDSEYDPDGSLTDLLATPMPEPTASPEIITSPSPTPSPTPVTNLANLYFDGSPQFRVVRIEKARRSPVPDGHISNDDNHSFYYQYENIAYQTSETTFDQGEKISVEFRVKNSEVTKSNDAKLIARARFSDNTAFEKIFDINALSKGEFDFIVFSPDEFRSKSGKVDVTLTIDSADNVLETNENDNVWTTSLTINPDETAPYLELYHYLIEQENDQVCFDFRAAFTRDNLDAIDGAEASKRTQLRWKTSENNSFTGWMDYKSVSANYPNPQCFDAEAKTYTATVESRDEVGNVASLTMSETVN